LIGSAVRFVRGHLGLRDVLTNWVATLKLPLVHLDLARDFWNDFDERYFASECALPSTFFVIPWEGYPGRLSQGSAPSFRASRYGAKDIAKNLRRMVDRGCEVGLHGIDAWLDSSKGAGEIEEIRRLTGAANIGTRMHWLYFNPKSPAALERAGA